MSGAIGQKDYGRISHALETLSAMQLFIDDTANIGVLEMRAKSRRLQAEHGLSLLVVDYIQLMSGRGRFENRTLELASISRSLKGLAKELNVPIVVLSQLSRAPEARSDHRPQLSDLRESGALEQDADVVVLIYRDDVYNQDPNSPDAGTAELIVAKQRNGPTGVVQARVPARADAVRESRAGRVTHRTDDPQHRRARRSRGAAVATSRAIQRFLTSSRRRAEPRISATRRAPADPARASSPSSRRTPTGTARARVALALEQAGATMLACADIEEGIVLRQAGVRVPILVFGALSVSDLDGLFEFSLTPTISTPGAARAVQAAAARTATTIGYHLKIDTGHEPARVPPRQPAAHAAGAAGQREPAARRRLHALRVRRRARESRLRRAARALRDGVDDRARTCARSSRGARRPTSRYCATPATAPRCCATRASGTTSCAPACCSTASCRRRWRRRFRCSR